MQDHVHSYRALICRSPEGCSGICRRSGKVILISQSTPVSWYIMQLDDS
jgi:hypothetical protein